MTFLFKVESSVLPINQIAAITLNYPTRTLQYSFNLFFFLLNCFDTILLVLFEMNIKLWNLYQFCFGDELLIESWELFSVYKSHCSHNTKPGHPSLTTCSWLCVSMFSLRKILARCITRHHAVIPRHREFWFMFPSFKFP